MNECWTVVIVTYITVVVMCCMCILQGTRVL